MTHLQHPTVHIMLNELREQELKRRAAAAGIKLSATGLAARPIRFHLASLLRRAADRLEPRQLLLRT